MARGKRAGSRRAPKKKAPSWQPSLLGLAGGVTLSVIAWGYLVYAAVDFGASARGGDSRAWALLGLASVGAMACLFLGLMLISRLMHRLGISGSPSPSPAARRTPSPAADWRSDPPSDLTSDLPAVPPVVPAPRESGPARAPWESESTTPTWGSGSASPTWGSEPATQAWESGPAAPAWESEPSSPAWESESAPPPREGRRPRSSTRPSRGRRAAR